jgi:hypothetical protein
MAAAEASEGIRERMLRNFISAEVLYVLRPGVYG